MTNNQLSYQRNIETERHNRVTEAQGWTSIAETHRHNLAQEDIGYKNIGLGYAQLAETHRHNQATEGLAWADLYERQRHNQAVEGETYRHNVAEEALSGRKIDYDYWSTEQKYQYEYYQTGERNRITEAQYASENPYYQIYASGSDTWFTHLSQWFWQALNLGQGQLGQSLIPKGSVSFGVGIKG